MIAVLLQAASACTPDSPHNERALVLLCAEEALALIMGRLNNSFSSVISPGRPRAPRPGRQEEGGPQGLVIENLMNSR
jgi:hypothetical protein